MSKEDSATAETKPFDLADMFGFDEKLGDTGVWFDYGAFGFKLRHVDATASRYQKIRERVLRPYREMIERQTLPDALDRKLSMTVFAEAFMVDWRTNVLDEDGQPTGKATAGIVAGGVDYESFSKESAVKLLLAFPKLFQRLTMDGATITNYRGDPEGDGKN